MGSKLKMWNRETVEKNRGKKSDRKKQQARMENRRVHSELHSAN